MYEFAAWYQIAKIIGAIVVLIAACIVYACCRSSKRTDEERVEQMNESTLKYRKGTRIICPHCNMLVGEANRDIYGGDVVSSKDWDGAQDLSSRICPECNPAGYIRALAGSPSHMGIHTQSRLNNMEHYYCGMNKVENDVDRKSTAKMFVIALEEMKRDGVLSESSLSRVMEIYEVIHDIGVSNEPNPQRLRRPQNRKADHHQNDRRGNAAR